MAARLGHPGAGMSAAPPRRPSARSLALGRMRMAGFHGDRAAFTRLYIESRIVLDRALDAFMEGQRAREAGARCGCFACTREPKKPLA